MPEHKTRSDFDHLSDKTRASKIEPVTNNCPKSDYRDLVTRNIALKKVKKGEST